MSTITAIQIETGQPTAGRLIATRPRPVLSAVLILAMDIIGLWATLWTFMGNTAIGRFAVPGSWISIWPLMALSLVLYWFFELYPGVAICPVDEIRHISLANTSICLFVSAAFALHRSGLSSLLICFSAFIVASIVILALRTTVRRVGSQFKWWGYPVVLFGCGAVAHSVLRKLKSQPHLGLRPVAVVSDDAVDRHIEGIPVCECDNLDQIAAGGVHHIIVAAPELSQSRFAEVMRRAADTFPYLILIPDSDSVWKVGSYTRDLIGVLGLHVQNNLLHGGARVAKRTIDLACSTVLIILLIPIFAVISLLIVLESGFPVFYSQKRLGHRNRPFQIWKFRTMVQNSSNVLKHSLANSPEMRREWAENQKLRDDPRITRVGKVLRKISWDELPQLWNVIKGEMSLVGPRPIVDAEVAKYDEAYSLYTKTTPGITGLWQVSGRNRTTYAERIAFDTYYVRNWSVWMDIYLLAKTVGAVFTGDGAY
jgi:Undecaprenyl-phosphate galactose phosphotransferase WbaP